MPRWIEVTNPRVVDRTAARAPVLSNDSEVAVARKLLAEGYEVLKTGWPDFLAVRGDEIRLIEVKPTIRPLRGAQQRMAELLKRHGLVVEVVAPESKFPARRRLKRPASERQIEYLQALLTEGRSEIRVNFSELGMREASDLIASLLRGDVPPTNAPAARRSTRTPQPPSRAASIVP